MTMSSIRYWLSLIPIVAIGIFFFVRELGTFPAAFIDDSLYMMTAKELASGNGIAILLLGHLWQQPPILHVSYPLLWPVALAIQTWGFSVEAARLPMIVYLCAASILLFLFTYKTVGRKSALWALLLLVTFSGFVNTGKPVMGEIPAITFLLAGIVLLPKALQSRVLAVITGLLFGCSILSKSTFALLLPALLVVLFFLMRERKRKELMNGGIVFLVALIALSSWKMLEIEANGMEVMAEYGERLLGGGTGWHLLGGNPLLLFTLPYLSFGFFLVTGVLGLLHSKRDMNRSQVIFYTALVALFILYFLSGPGWYRHLLPAHVLLLPFVPKGIQKWSNKKVAIGVLCLIVAVQTWWQFDHKGSSMSTTPEEAVAIIEKEFATTPLIIRQAEIFVRLPKNPNWVYFPHETLAERLQEKRHEDFEKAICTMGQILKLSDEEIGERHARRVAGSYAYILPMRCR